MHVQMFEVPRSYSSTIRETYVDGRMTFFNQLLQVVIGNYAVIYNIENVKEIREIKYIETTDQFLKPENYVQTGFVMSSSHSDIEDGYAHILRQSIVTNVHQNLLFSDEVKIWQSDQSVEKTIPGIIFRTNTYTDLCELRQICKDLRENKKLEDIDPETVVAQFEGHTLFSIFFDRI